MNKGKKIEFLSYLYSGDNDLGIKNIKFIPRWLIYFQDIFLSIISYIIYIEILKSLNSNLYTNTHQLFVNGLLIISLQIVYFYIYKTYSGIIRHASFVDFIKIALVCSSTIFSLLLLHYVLKMVLKMVLLEEPVSIILYGMVCFLLLLWTRIFLKMVYTYIYNYTNNHQKQKILIFGDNEHAINLSMGIENLKNLNYVVDGFISLNRSHQKKIINKPVYFLDYILNNSLNFKYLGGVVLDSRSMKRTDRMELVNQFLERKIKVYNSPQLGVLDHQKLKDQMVKAIDIDDLLERSPIKMDDTTVRSDLFGKNILVTGGAGSIGSEIVRQVAKYQPKTLVVLDQAETPLHNLELEMKILFPSVNIIFHLADISNKYRLENIFEKYKFSIVYHAAAYKHVPIVEKNPQEAVNVNVLGTMNLVQLSKLHEVERFVMISTDKAVNPTNVMGATKRVAELYVQAVQNLPDCKTKFITTRFGNVLGSNGSVIPLFKKQIAAGGPISVTHPDIIRYFMTITEACELVLQAGTMGNGGEIYVFDMGNPVKIIDLAIKMIKLSGLVPYKDIDIIITGLRPGEKLYEELLSNTSENLPTHHEKIQIARDQNVPYDFIQTKTKEVLKMVLKKDNIAVVKILKEIVPEYISQNSQFEILDK